MGQVERKARLFVGLKSVGVVYRILEGELMGLTMTESEVLAHQARIKRKGIVVPPRDGILRFELPEPISLNNAYGNTPNGRVLTRTARDFKNYVEKEARAQAEIQGWVYETGRRIGLSLTITFSQKRRDLDNSVKLASDSICKALGFDDSVIDILLVQRAGTDAALAKTVVEVRMI